VDQNGYITSNGLNLYYEIHGSGLPIILLNGGPGFPHGYLHELKSLAANNKLVFFDQRGTGLSDKTNPENYTIAANVRDVEALRQQLNLGDVIVFGHSWGGMLAQAYVLEHPNHVAKLILADTFSSSADIDIALARMRASVPDEIEQIYIKYERAGLYQDRDTYPLEYQEALQVAYEPVSLAVPPPEYLENVFSKLAYDVYRVMWGEETEFKITGTLAGFDVFGRLGEIKAPTLVIVGAQDMPSVDMAHKTANSIPGAKLVVFEHSRHYPFIEEPDRFIAVMREFLQS
jgi:proline-specific peptidase